MRVGRVLLGTVAAVTAVGGFAADWNRTHLFNPAWPPHAKFHDAQTIVLGSLLGGAGLYFLSREGDTRRGATLAAALPGMFWAAQGGSFAFPGAEGLEAEFPELVPRIEGVWVNERFAAGLMLGLASLGYLLEHRRLREPATATGRPDLRGP